MPAVLDRDLAPVRQRAVAGLVGQRPLPRLPPQIPARATATGDLAVRARLKSPVLRTLHILVGAFLTGDMPPSLRGFAASCGASPDLTHQQLVGSDERERRPRRDHPARRRRLRNRHVRGQANALAPALPTGDSRADLSELGYRAPAYLVHQQFVVAMSANDGRAAISLPASAGSATASWWPARHAAHHEHPRPDPPVRHAAHSCAPRISSPVTVGMYVRVVSPRQPGSANHARPGEAVLANGATVIQVIVERQRVYASRHVL